MGRPKQNPPDLSKVNLNPRLWYCIERHVFDVFDGEHSLAGECPIRTVNLEPVEQLLEVCIY